MAKYPEGSGHYDPGTWGTIMDATKDWDWGKIGEGALIALASALFISVGFEGSWISLYTGLREMWEGYNGNGDGKGGGK